MPTPLQGETPWRNRFCPQCDAALTPAQHRRLEASDTRVRAALRRDLNDTSSPCAFRRTRLAMAQHELGRILHEAGLPSAQRSPCHERTPQLDMFETADNASAPPRTATS